jgi:hypothetical protein
MKWKTTIPEGTIIQQKENKTNVNTNTVIYASVAGLGLHYQQPQKLEHSDINRTLHLILTKITNLEGTFSKMNERVKKLESDITTTFPTSKNK